MILLIRYFVECKNTMGLGCFGLGLSANFKQVKVFDLQGLIYRI